MNIHGNRRFYIVTDCKQLVVTNKLQSNYRLSHENNKKILDCLRIETLCKKPQPILFSIITHNLSQLCYFVIEEVQFLSICIENTFTYANVYKLNFLPFFIVF